MEQRIKTAFKKQAVLPLILLLYFSLALFNINYPGLNTDEAFNGVVSSNIFRDISEAGSGNVHLLYSYIHPFGKILPVMSSQYYGPVVPYLIHPFIRLFGPGTFALRFASIFILAFFLIFIYRLCKAWFGKKAGLLAVLFTATNLAFVQYSRVALFRCEIFVALFFWAGLYFLAQYASKKKAILLFLGFFAWGLSLSVKISFLYFALASVLAYFLVGRHEQVLGKYKIRQIPFMLFSFCAGSLFMIIYNILNPWITLKQLAGVLTDPGATAANTIGEGANNLDYLANLIQRFIQYFDLLKGELSEQFFWGVHYPVPAVFLLAAGSLLAFSLIFMFGLVLFSSRLDQNIRRRMLFLYIIYAGVFFLSPLTLSGLNQGHLVFLFPFAQVCLAVFLCRTPDLWNRSAKRIVSTLALLLATGTILLNIFTNLYYNIQMRSSGGSGRWSTAINELADYLKNKAIVSPVMLEYDLQANLIFLTQNRVAPVIYDKFYPGTLQELFPERYRVFYLSINGPQGDPGKAGPGGGEEKNGIYPEKFKRYIAENGKTQKLEKLFMNRSGLPVYWLYSIDQLK